MIGLVFSAAKLAVAVVLTAGCVLLTLGLAVMLLVAGWGTF